MRKPNTICAKCNNPVYQRPNAKGKAFCNNICYANYRSLEKIKCQNCDNIFQPWKKSSRYCSKECSNHSKIGSKYSEHKFPGKSATERRLNELKFNFNFTTCMVEECSYNKTFDVHRLIPGKNGGEYKIGNMFAICPNHHAEEHRKLIKLEKVNDYTLREIKIWKDKPIGDGTPLEAGRG